MATDIRVPEMGESVTEASIANWLKQIGESVAAGEPVVELETDKVNLEVPSPVAGVLASQEAAAGDIVRPGDLLATVAAAVAAEPPPAAVKEPAKTTPAVAEASAPAEAAVAAHASAVAPPAAPTIRQLARAQGVDLAAVTGSGPSGRIRREDLVQVPPVPATPVAAPGEELVERQKMSRRRQTIAKRLVEAQHTAAMLTTFNEVDMSRVMAIRSQYKDAFKERHGVSLGFMSFFTRATVEALKAFPRLNAEVSGDEIWLKRYYHIGVAVSTDEGLVVPVVRHADEMTFAQIEREIQRLAKRARERELTIADLQGGTFTITNGGVFGSLFSTPILNQPEVGILGMHTIQERPVA
ncbi:MAG: 2-oxoglutarate dehydrogenase complex dihydrolipoyllysine-residue succinyltransferase, partial [Sulfobacillus sp.]